MLLQEKANRKKQNRLADYKPYCKQKEFHAGGASHRERLLMAGNQLGKTLSAGAELAMHLTGNYPEWWEGRRWSRPVVAWVASETMEVSRDAAQRILLGRETDRGTGMIPGKLLGDARPYPNVAGACSKVHVRHATGGWSVVIFKSYDQGRKRFQGDSIDIFWPDEEPPLDIYTEGLTRTNATKGMVMMTFTPLQGMSETVLRFLGKERTADMHITTMTIEDAEHYTPEERARIIASYPPHEREARARGIPTLGSGKVFVVPESEISEGYIDMPAHWARIVGMDFGADHPTAAVWLAWDRDRDVVHVYDVYRKSDNESHDLRGVALHAPAIRSKGEWIPVAWPHDGLQHDKGSGEQLAEQYRRAGLNMLPERATFEDGGNGVEAGIAMMTDRLQTKRLLVAAHLEQWWEEYRMYHRKDGLIVKERDDLMAATRYGLMMLRYAVSDGGGWAAPIKYKNKVI